MKFTTSTGSSFPIQITGAQKVLIQAKLKPIGLHLH